MKEGAKNRTVPIAFIKLTFRGGTSLPAQVRFSWSSLLSQLFAQQVDLLANPQPILHLTAVYERTYLAEPCTTHRSLQGRC